MRSLIEVTTEALDGLADDAAGERRARQPQQARRADQVQQRQRAHRERREPRQHSPPHDCRAQTRTWN